MRSRIPLVLVFLTGTIMVAQFFVPHEYSEFAFQYADDFVIVIGILAMPVGIVSLMSATVRKARSEPRERLYSLATIAGFAVMLIAGLKRDWFTGDSTLHAHLFDSVLMAGQSTIFSLLAFYLASAAYRAFRARTLLAALLLVTAFVVMLRLIPLPEPLARWDAALVRWILEVPNMAAKRAIIIGVGLGAITYSVKILLGLERAYMGGD